MCIILRFYTNFAKNNFGMGTNDISNNKKTIKLDDSDYSIGKLCAIIEKSVGKLLAYSRKFILSIRLRKIFRALPNYVLPYYTLYKEQKKQKWLAEKKISCGELNKDRIFYVIRRDPPGAGLLSNFHWVLGHVIYAVKKGFTPVVDMQNYKTFYSEKKVINGTVNAWEYYFTQPSVYTLDEVYKSKNVILCKMEYLQNEIPSEFNYIYNKEDITKYYNYITKYIPLNSCVANYARESESLLFGERKNILGVYSRGTDYKYATGHYTPTSTCDLINKAQELLFSWKMEWIYLVSEEVEVIEKFRQIFKNQLIVTDSKRIKNYQQYMGVVPLIDFGRQNDKYLRNLEYLRDIVLLSKCDSLICSKTNGSVMAIELNNNKYKNVYIFDSEINK
jgi:hypothetical protein